MVPEVKKVWIDALRSGDYEQGNGALRTGDRFCCLGVLCDLAVKAGLNVDVEELKFYPSDPPHWSYDGETGTLPSSVREWAGLSSHNPSVLLPDDFADLPGVDPDWVEAVDGAHEALGGINDAGFDFEQIANLIDVQL